MAERDWTYLTNGLSITSLDRSVTAGIAPPNGGGTFVFGFNSLVVEAGAAGLFANLANFAPMPKGGRISAAIQRGVSAGNLNFSPLIFIGLQGTSVADSGYLLGLSDDYPAHIALRKGQLAGGIPSGAPGTLGILRRSSTTHAAGTWLHLRLDMIVNASGDVVLKALQNDLTVNPVTAPVWEAVPGMDDFIDDALGVNSGSQPFINGRAGFAFATSDVNRRGYFDHIELARQL